MMFRSRVVLAATAVAALAAPAPAVASSGFKGTICQPASANGACIKPAAASVTYAATQGVAKYFKVFINAPPTNPGFDPAQRRMYIYFTETRAEPSNTSPFIVGAASVGVKKN